MAAFAADRRERTPTVDQAELEELRVENARLSEPLKELAIELSLQPEGRPRALRPGAGAGQR